MNIANPNNHGFTPHSGEPSNSFSGASNPANHSSLQGRKSPFKYPQQNKSRQFNPKYEKYEGSKYQSTSFSDRFNTQATFTDSISQDQPGENRWLSKWSRDLRGVSGIDLDNPPPSQLEENRSSKTLSTFPVFQGAYQDLERSKSHSRTRSSPYGVNENYSGGNNNLSQDFISPRLRKEEIAGLKERKRLERRRGVNEVTPRSNIANNRNLKTEASTDDQDLKVLFYRTERVGSKGFFSPQYGEGEFDTKGKYFGIDSTKQKHVSKKSEDRKHRPKKSEAVSFEEEPYRSREYKELRENRDSSLYNDVMGSKDYRKHENKGLSDMRKSKVVDENNEKRHREDRVDKLEKELRDCQDKLLQAEKFQNQLYQNYVEAKGELEKYREEKEDLMSNISFQMSQNSILKDQISQLHERSSMGGRESQKLRDLDFQKSERIASLEDQVAKLKTSVVMETRKCESQIDNYQAKIEKLEREKHAALFEKEKLETRMEEYLQQQEKSNMEDKVILKKSLEERNRQVKTLKQVNEELTRDLEKLKKQKHEKGDRQYASERETAVTGRYDIDRQETKRMIEEAFNQTKREKSPDMVAELRKYKAEVEKLKAENESLKLEVQGQSTLRRFDHGDSYEEKLEDMKEKDKKLGKTSQMGELGRVMRDIMKEVGVDDINDAAVRIRDLKEGNKIHSKFADGVLDLVYRCSPAGYFETRPTVKQAWKWLQRLMEEYMTMKKRTGSANIGETSTAEKEIYIISSLIESLKVQDKSEIVERVKNILEENDRSKKSVEKEKIPVNENSFEGGDVEKMMDKYGASYSSLSHSYSTARFEDISKVQSRNSKEFSFARTSGKVKKIMEIDGVDLTDELTKKIE